MKIRNLIKNLKYGEELRRELIKYQKSNKSFSLDDCCDIDALINYLTFSLDFICDSYVTIEE